MYLSHIALSVFTIVVLCDSVVSEPWPRPVTMQPAISVDLKGSTAPSWGAEDKRSMVYTYYMPFPKTRLSSLLTEVLDAKKITPLLRMLMASETSHGMKETFQKVLNGFDMGVLPFMASCLSDMNVGFFAYKPASVVAPDGKEASEELHLFTLQTKALLGGAAPHQHPLGPIWVENAGYIINMLQSSEATLTVQSYKMTANTTGPHTLQSSLIRRIQNEKLALKKRKLESENDELRTAMRRNDSEIKRLATILKDADEPDGERSPMNPSGPAVTAV